MRILIITQSVDTHNPVLGFFHEWIKGLSSQFEKVTVICLEAGTYSLPNNVQVFSLGKEKGVSKFTYLKNFFTLIWREKYNYDAVFVHMNEEYVILAGLLWRIWGKKIVLWRNHAKGNILTRAAVCLANKVLCTSPNSFTAQYKKTSICAAGIDTDFFQISQRTNLSGPLKILILGRISRVKNLHIIFTGLRELKDVSFVCTVVGSPITSDDQVYFNELKEQFADLLTNHLVQFVGDCAHEETKKYFQSHDLYINATNSGSLDKTIVEAMASGCLPIMVNTSFKQWLPDDIYKQVIFKENDSHALTAQVLTLVALGDEERGRIRNELRNWVEKDQSLSKLMAQISQNLQA